MNKRYQVFVSSTYADLRDERQHVLQTLMEMDCIPAGMELFPAADEEQWEFIKSVIDDCDYYLLIIGGRYGSLTADGVSYTEKEYEYAVESGLRVIALLHNKPGEIPLDKSEGDPELRKKLQDFRDVVSEGRLVKFWNSADQLPGLVSLSLTKTIKTHPAVGWVRANRVSNEDVLNDLNEVRKENDVLKERLAEFKGANPQPITDLAGLDTIFEVNGSYRDRNGRFPWAVQVSWREIFFLLSPYLMKHPEALKVKSVLLENLAERAGYSQSTPFLEDQDFQTIGIQLKALGLVAIAYLKSTKGNMGLFWSLTTSGENLMLELRTKKSGSE